MRSAAVSIAATLLAALGAAPEEVRLPGTEVRQLNSTINGQGYRILVALPRGYAPGGTAATRYCISSMPRLSSVS